MWPQGETEERFREQRSFLYSQILETRGTAYLARPHRKDTRVVRRQKMGTEGSAFPTAFIGVSLGKARQGKVNNLGLLI